MRGAFEINKLWGQRSPAKAIAQIDQKQGNISFNAFCLELGLKYDSRRVWSQTS